MKYRSSIVACARWESEAIEEWIDYHLALGYDHVYLVCNDEDPSELYDKVFNSGRDRRSLVDFEHYSDVGQQRAMYLKAMLRARAESEWISFLDIDEFLTLKQWKSVGALIDDLSQDDIAGVHFNWLNFGNSSFKTRPSGSVLAQYNKRSKWFSKQTKHLTRSDLLSEESLATNTMPFWHVVTGPAVTDKKRVNVLKDPIDPMVRDFPQSMSDYLTEDHHHRQLKMFPVGYVSHFFIKSEEDFERRLKRGAVGEFVGQGQWAELYRNGNVESVLASLNDIEDNYLKDLAAKM